jgi:hypothetical protein
VAAHAEESPVSDKMKRAIPAATEQTRSSVLSNLANAVPPSHQRILAGREKSRHDEVPHWDIGIGLHASAGQ